MAATTQKRCASCGQGDRGYRINGSTACGNAWCAAAGRALGAIFWAGAYEGPLRRAIVQYKYGGDLRWARPFANILHGFLARHANWFEEHSLICPVPSFAGPGARRSFGHVELVCAELACLAGPFWPVEGLVTKFAETQPMSAQPQGARRKIGQVLQNNALRTAPGARVEGSRVLVVDDVCASGETLRAVATVLARAGAEEVTGLVLAKASWRRPNV